MATKTRSIPTVSRDDLAAMSLLEKRIRWLATWTIHNANHLRESRDGLKVGGHQASSASMTAIMTALYFHVLRPQDRVAVKPHASPVYHAIQYLLGRQDLDQLKRFRAFGGAQSYPSRTKDKDDVDFSTGSVGLGVAVTAFASLVQDYVIAKGWLDEKDRGRMISILGDAELDEGNIYEALIEAAKHDIRNTWWIVDYNRQSLDAITADRMFARFEDIFEAAGWEVVTLKYGKRLQEAFAQPGGETLRRWIDACPNDLYAALCYEGGAAWRERLSADIGTEAGVADLLGAHDDASLAHLMIDLGGHCLESLLEAFHGAADDHPRLFLCYTIKGHGLPFQGHKDNHAGLMTPAQMDSFRESMGVEEGSEWEPFAGLSHNEAPMVERYLKNTPFAEDRQRRKLDRRFDVPEISAPTGASQATQTAFGKILNDLARSEYPLADRLVTTSPDVTVSTNLGGFVNVRGIFDRDDRDDVFRKLKIASPQKWSMSPKGQHIELGIAENNLFLMLAALGLSETLFGAKLLPIGTLYDPFIARGLDALNYACYQDARFLLVATPSGLTLAPEGGAHQSIGTPLIGMGQPGLSYFEPAYVDELAEIMAWSLAHMQAEDGGSVYLRLSTRTIPQPARTSDAWRGDLTKGAYWQIAPDEGADLAVVYTGAVAPEAVEAHSRLLEEVPGAGLLAVPSADIAHRDWRAADSQSHIARLLERLSPDAALVTVIDGSPATLSWLGSVRGQCLQSLGVERFGQVGDIVDLYREYRLDADAIFDAAAAALVERARRRA